MTNRLSRRTVLRGFGAALGLPMLEAMTPLTSFGAEEVKAPVRMAFFYVPNGMNMSNWTPEKLGEGYDLPETLSPLAPFRKDMNVLSGLTLNGARSLGDGGGDHARSVAAFLTGAHPKKTNGADIQNGASVDQFAAGKIGSATRLPSLELGLESSAQSGRCDSGYSCVYTSNMSWRTPTSPVAKETNPQAVFDRLFGNADENESKRNQARRIADRKSILDFVLEDAGDLQRQLGASDRVKLDEYLYAVREIERRISESDKLGEVEPDVPDYPRPKGSPAEFSEHLRMMFDLITLAFQTDSTRIVTFMYTNAGSNRSYRNIDVSDGHHSLSHHGNNKSKLEKIGKVNKYHVEQFAYLVKKFKEAREESGSLLDNSMLMYGSGIGDGNKHNHDDLPIALLGKAGGSIPTGRHLQYRRDTPLTNLYRTMLAKVGAPTDKFGDSNGLLEHL